MVSNMTNQTQNSLYLCLSITTMSFRTLCALADKLKVSIQYLIWIKMNKLTKACVFKQF